MGELLAHMCGGAYSFSHSSLCKFSAEVNKVLPGSGKPLPQDGYSGSDVSCHCCHIGTLVPY